MHTRERLVEMCTAAIQSRRLSSGTAAKMRGLATWMDAALAGRCLRAAGHALTARQYWDQCEEVTEGSNLWESLLYIAAAAQWMPDRCISLVRPVAPPVRVYTDASADADRVRLGAKVLLPDGCTLVTVLDADQPLRETWGPQDTVINQAELQCGTLVAATFAEELRGHDVIWRVDNTSAATSLVKAGSPTATMCRLALQASALLAALGCRCWFEHVPSADNPADVLSRDALDDPTVASMLAGGFWIFRQPVLPAPFSRLTYQQLWCWTGDNELA